MGQVGGRVGRGRRADRLGPGRPAAAEAREGGIDAAGQPVALAVGAALDVRPLEIPAGQEGAVLALHDAVLEQGGPVQQVADAGRLVPEVLEGKHPSQHPVEEGCHGHDQAEIEAAG